MAEVLFSGFFYIQGNNSGNTNSGIPMTDFSFGYNENIGSPQKRITMVDILNKISKPVFLTYSMGGLNLNIITTNYGYEGTPSGLLKDRTLINPLATTGDDSIWKRIFKILNYIYFSAASKNDDQINSALSNTSDPDYSSDYAGYINNSLFLLRRDDNYTNKLNKIEFKIALNLVDVYYISVYVNPLAFMDPIIGYVAENPLIEIYYDPEGDDSQNTTVAEITKIIAKESFDNYRAMTVHLYGNPNLPLTFHIWTKGLNIPTDPLSDVKILTAVQNKIKSIEEGAPPKLSMEQLSEKYPTIFSMKIRIIFPIKNNYTIDLFKIRDSNGNLVTLISNPISINTIQDIISRAAPLRSVANNGVIDTFNTYEIFYIGPVPRHPYIVAGSNGALTDIIHMYTPYVNDSSALPSNDPEADKTRIFHSIITQLYNYINYNSTIDPTTLTTYLIVVTDEYIQFKYLGILWRFYK